MVTVWTGTRTSALRDLTAQGMRPRLAAERLGVSLDAVSSKLKLMRRAARASPPASKLRAPPVKPDPWSLNLNSGRVRPAVRAPFAVLRMERFAPLVTSKPTRFDDLPAGRCKWPLGDIMAKELICCGGHATGPYCDPHEAWNRNKDETAYVDSRVIKSAVALARRRLAA